LANESSGRPLFPIGAVVEKTGLSAHVLRAWERRYGAVVPKRRDDGIRVYDDADIVKLRLLKRVTESGHGIGGVANLPTETLLELVRDEPETRARSDKGAAKRQMAECLKAVELMDSGRVHGLLMRSLVIMGSERFVEALVVPLLHRVGELWDDGSIFPAHEHLVSAALQRVLGWMMDQLEVDDGSPTIVTSTPTGQRHEMGALLSGVVAAEERWRVEYLGADLPAEDIARAVTRASATVVALSVIHSTDADSLFSELSGLREQLPGNVTILLGGKAISGQAEKLARMGVMWLPDLGALRDQLRRLRLEHAAGAA